MNINAITPNYAPRFEARIKINKQGLQNLGKDAVDTGRTALGTTLIIPSAVTETTIFPSEYNNSGSADNMKVLSNGIKNTNRAISNRPLDITVSEGEASDTEALGKSALNSVGGLSALASAGGLSTLAAASGADQAVNYPSLGSEYLPKNIIETLENWELQQSMYDYLWHPNHCAGNECASLDSSFLTSTAVASYAGGSLGLSDAVKGAGKIIKGDKNIPS